MNPAQLTWAKFGAIGLVLVGGFVLVAIGKLDAAAMYSQTTTMVGALVVALGISAGGQAMAAGQGKAAALLSATTMAMRGPEIKDKVQP